MKLLINFNEFKRNFLTYINNIMAKKLNTIEVTNSKETLFYILSKEEYIKITNKVNTNEQK